jgi:uncharacterized membrane protein YccC
LPGPGRSSARRGQSRAAVSQIGSLGEKRDSTERRRRRREETVVGADDEHAVVRLDGDVPITSDARIDDRQQDRVGAQVRQRVDEQHRAATDVERGHPVREIDDRACRWDAVVLERCNRLRLRVCFRSAGAVAMRLQAGVGVAAPGS